MICEGGRGTGMRCGSTREVVVMMMTPMMYVCSMQWE